MKLVGIVVCLNGNHEFLIIRRSSIDERAGEWTMPGGHIEESDDSIENGAARELKEEANLDCSVQNMRYLGSNGKNKYYFWAKEWTGDVNIDKPNPETGKIEHDQYRWATIDDIKEIDNSKIPIYLLEKALEMSENETDS